MEWKHLTSKKSITEIIHFLVTPHVHMPSSTQVLATAWLYCSAFNLSQWAISEREKEKESLHEYAKQAQWEAEAHSPSHWGFEVRKNKKNARLRKKGKKLQMRNKKLSQWRSPWKDGKDEKEESAKKHFCLSLEKEVLSWVCGLMREKCQLASPWETQHNKTDSENPHQELHHH